MWSRILKIKNAKVVPYSANIVVIIIKRAANMIASKIHNSFERLMEIYLFDISKGDEKQLERIEYQSTFIKELFA